MVAIKQVNDAAELLVKVLEKKPVKYKEFLEMDTGERGAFLRHHGFDPEQVNRKWFMRPTDVVGFPKGIELRNAAFWVSPAGRFYDIDKGLDERHIYYLVDNPELFGFTRQHILDTYQKYGEPNPYERDNDKRPIEGEARQELIIDAVKRGWIRIRNFMKLFQWTVNVYQLDSITRERLTRWAKAVIANSNYGGCPEVKIDTAVSRVITTSVKNIADGDFSDISSSRTRDYGTPFFIK